MGQHKHNPTAIAEKAGEIPPKPRATMTKRESERQMYQRINEYLTDRLGLGALRAAMGGADKWPY